MALKVLLSSWCWVAVLLTWRWVVSLLYVVESGDDVVAFGGGVAGMALGGGLAAHQ